MKNLFPKVIQAVACENRTVYAYMNDGTIHLLDVKPIIAQGGVFARLSDDTFSRDV